jgi:hypothetical protein
MAFAPHSSTAVSRWSRPRPRLRTRSLRAEALRVGLADGRQVPMPRLKVLPVREMIIRGDGPTPKAPLEAEPDMSKRL